MPAPNMTKQGAPLEFEAIGTSWHITFSETTHDDAQKIADDIVRRIDDFDRQYSRFITTSVLRQMSRPGAYRLPADAAPLFDLYDNLFLLTEGAMTPLIGGLLEDMGYDADYSLIPRAHVRAVPDWRQAVTYDFPHLLVHQPIVLDVGAAGKGYIIDLIAKLLLERDISTFSINAGGDILHHSDPLTKTMIGLENPFHHDEVIGYVELGNKSICGSSNNRRQWGGQAHIMHAKTKSSATPIAAVWTIADTAMIADGISTALFFTSASVLRTHYAFEHLILYNDGHIEGSTHFPAMLYTNDIKRGV